MNVFQQFFTFNLPPPAHYLFDQFSYAFFFDIQRTGTYKLAQASGVTRGTKIILHLKDDCKEFSDKTTVKDILTTHSNFVNFKIRLNGEQINTVEAIWTKSKNEVSEEEHEAFYKFIANAHDKPRARLHFQTDTPLNISSIFYVPQEHTEKYGIGKMEPGVSLYCRKVLIQPNMKKLLPEYLRFIKGVIDCEGIPLNLSREHLQDSSLIARISAVVSRRILKFLADEAKRDPAEYDNFFGEFGQFLKEGVVSESNDREMIAKLLRMETSQLEAGKTTSFDDYISRMKEDQKEIYYIVTQKRDLAIGSPYMEHFKKKNIEVLFLYHAIDDWVINSLQNYKGKDFKAIESADIDKDETELSEEERAEQKVFNEWIRDILFEKVSSVKDTNRLTDTPAVIIDHESLSFRRMMMQVDPKRMPKLPKQQLEINAKHPIMAQLRTVRHSNPELATQIVEQVYDNALFAAGLITEVRPMLDRVNSIIERTLEFEAKKQ